MTPGVLAPAKPVPAPARSARARERLPAARAALAECRLCAHNCGVNRFQSSAGECHAGVQARIFSAQTEVSDELELIPTFAIAFSGCDLRCDFCITGRESWNARAGFPTAPARIAAAARDALARGARTIMFLGGEPTIHLPTVLELVAALPDEANLVWKTNGHGNSEARRFLAGMFDVWVVDYKFGNDDCARRLARVPHYTAVVRHNLEWAHANTGLIVRHLVMPGHVDCCWRPVATWLAEHMPGAKVNLRTGFWPAWQSRRHRELTGTVTPRDASEAVSHARSLGLNLVD